MDALSAVIFLSVLGLVLLVGELLLPTHGVLGVAGILALAGAIAACFWINQWLGLGVLVGAVAASPFVAAGAVYLWPKTPVGKRVLLPPPAPTLPPAPLVRIGQHGTAVTELRPIGECDFGDIRLEAISEQGILPAGSKVKVVALAAGRPTVRSISNEESSHG